MSQPPKPGCKRLGTSEKYEVFISVLTQQSTHGNVVAIFPARDSLIRLVGAVLAEQHDEWTEQQRYIGLDVLAKSRLTIVENNEPEEVTLTAITA